MGSRSPVPVLSGLTAALLLCSAAAPAALAQDLLQSRPGGAAALISKNVVNAVLPVEEAFALQLDSAGKNRLQLQWRIAPDHYLYRKSLQLILSDGTVLEASLPAGEAIEDEFFGAVEVYYESLALPLPPEPLAAAAHTAATPDSLTLEVHFQGCAEDRYCYPPHQQTLVLPLP